MENHRRRKGIFIKMKKFITILFTVTILSLTCACGQVNMNNARINHTADMTGIAKLIEECSIIQKEKLSLLPEDERRVYEAYLAAYGDEERLYTYFDYDNDGKMELYICRSEDSYGYVIKYFDGGLTTIDRGTVSKENIDGLEWNEIERDSSSDNESTDEWTHEGVAAFIDQNPYDEQCLWYMDEASFLSQYGFAESTPFYEYTLPDGSIRLILYYDEQTGLGCGIRYFERDPSDIVTSGIYGFSFVGMTDEADLWSDGLSVDYTKFESCYGETGSDYVSSYEENIEYDDAGKVVHFDSSGIYEEDDEEPSYILWMDYEYDDNGLLNHRQYYHNPRIIGTWYQVWDSYFDGLGRLEHEYLYITHGWVDYYYIYSDESAQPSYCLFLDDNLGWWMPEFVKYSNEEE